MTTNAENACICRHHDAAECYALRYGSDPDDHRQDDGCSCGCHAEAVDEDEDDGEPERGPARDVTGCDV